MAETRNIDQIVADAVERAVHAYFQYQGPPRGPQRFRDIWITTSGHPCVFCAAMESLSQIANVPVGDPFPVPIWNELLYARSTDLTYAHNPPSHRSCQCYRLTVSILG